jgi:hypothetical protein
VAASCLGAAEDVGSAVPVAGVELFASARALLVELPVSLPGCVGGVAEIVTS